MVKGKSYLLASLLALGFSTGSYAVDKSHFFVQMQNLTQKDVSVSFRKGNANVDLNPVLVDNTLLPAQQKSAPYGVEIIPMDHTATFNIIFKGNKECNFNIGFYAPGRPRVITEGLGCLGTGSQIVEHGSTLLLYVSDINLQK
ncbi:MAG: hypothetical protein ACYCQI_16140 [Gammaproteobacteria bacterium]